MVCGICASRRAFLTHEAIHPDDAFGRMMCENLSERGCPLLGIRALKTVADHEARLRAVGYRSANGATMAAIYKGTPQPDRRRLDGIEMIDEWEEWELVHHHYGIVAASNTDAELVKVADLCKVGTAN
jgi:hypothetical protein